MAAAGAGSLAAAAGSNGSSLRALGQQVAAGKGASALMAGADAGSAPLTKGVKAHAVMLSQSALAGVSGGL
jgi:hypothetical protein